MKGITFYKEDIKHGVECMTDEELGFVFRTFMEHMDDEIIPTFEDSRLDMLTDGFKNDMKKTIRNVVARRENGSNESVPKLNQNNSKIKPNKNFDKNSDEKRIKYGKYKGKQYSYLKKDCPLYLKFLYENKYPMPHDINVWVKNKFKL